FELVEKLQQVFAEHTPPRSMYMQRTTPRATKITPDCTTHTPALCVGRKSWDCPLHPACFRHFAQGNGLLPAKRPPGLAHLDACRHGACMGPLGRRGGHPPDRRAAYP